MTTNFRLKALPQTTSHNMNYGKENNSLVIQNSISSDIAMSSADVSSHEISKSRRTSGQDSVADG